MTTTKWCSFCWIKKALYRLRCHGSDFTAELSLIFEGHYLNFHRSSIAMFFFFLLLWLKKKQYSCITEISIVLLVSEDIIKLVAMYWALLKFCIVVIIFVQNSLVHGVCIWNTCTYYKLLSSHTSLTPWLSPAQYGCFLKCGVMLQEDNLIRKTSQRKLLQ